MSGCSEACVTNMRSSFFSILGQRVRVDGEDPELGALLHANFGAMTEAHPGSDAADTPDLRFVVARSQEPAGYVLSRHGDETLRGTGQADFVYDLEKAITLALQRLRADLLFLHAAAIVFDGRAVLIAAESGAGKSTTTWGLLHHGFHYLSDELSPVDVESMRVFPYPHALSLKRAPPAAYPLPSGAMDLGRTIHVPAQSLPTPVVLVPCPLRAVFLLKYSADHAVPSAQRIGTAEASARLYVNALNPLAHPLHGLDAVVRIAESVPCFDVASADLSQTCTLILERLAA